jgi:hypothetical protein
LKNSARCETLPVVKAKGRRFVFGQAQEIAHTTKRHQIINQAK